MMHLWYVVVCREEGLQLQCFLILLCTQKHVTRKVSNLYKVRVVNWSVCKAVVYKSSVS